MKVSKVDHVKSGIDQKPSEQRGMLYKQPQKKMEGNQLEEHVRNLNQKAMRLYQVFRFPVDKKPDKDLLAVNKFMKIILDALCQGKSSISIVTLIGSYNSGVEISEKHIQNFVDQNLKESLRRYICIENEKVYIPDIMIDLLNSKFSPDFSQNAIDSKRLMGLIDFIKEDYLKENQIKKIVYSIENNNTPVKVGEVNGQKRLILSSADNKKKSYVFEFLKEYANANEKEQSELLRHMKYLILLYFYGPDKITDDYKDEISEWNFGSIVLDNERLFSENASMLIQDREYVNQQIIDGNRTKDKEKIKENKAKYRKIGDKIREDINKNIVWHYQKACEVVEEKDISWVRYISDHTASVLSKKNQISPDKLSLSYLCKNTWNTWVSFIAMKYVDMGKGVYHFAMSNVGKVGRQDNVIIGQINSEFVNGISSFDYERIKADDDLHRSMSGYVSFAVNNFSKAVCGNQNQNKKGQEDILTRDWNTISFDEETKKRVLQYFGGASNWSGTLMDIIDARDLAACVKENLYIARNVNFHFAGSENGCKKQDDILEELVNKEIGDVGKYYRKGFYSNNVTTFYSNEDVTKLMNHLYQKEKSYQAQIPSYNKVISRTYLPNLIFLLIKGKNRVKISEPEVMSAFSSAFYFVLKEIYYNNFLQEENLKEMFCKGLENAQKEEKTKKPYENFMNRFHELEAVGMDFGEICQQIMTDYELQNSQKKKTASAVVQNKKNGNLKILNKDNQKYKHFRTLLYIGLREAFVSYLKDDKNKEWYEFLREPKVGTQPDEEEFVKGWTLDQYTDRSDLILADSMVGAWYVVAHFINQAQLNHLIGDIKNYIQFIQDIDRRAKCTGNRVSERTKEQTERYKKVLNVLEFAKFSCGQTTNNLYDYYQDENDFASHVGHFVKFEKKNEEPKQALQAFCASEYKAGKVKKKIGIYYDGMHPIINRNVALASMYGNEKLLAKTMIPVTENEIRKFYSLQAELDPLFKKGAVCETEDEQKKLRHFQNLKNRIELVDVLSLSELANDLIAQLIGWAYIRERDMMYLQLGLYYIKLYFTDSIPEDSFLRTMDLEKGSIADGAVLYQIVSMYSFDLPIFVKENEDSVAIAQRANSVGAKFKIFEREYCKIDGYVDSSIIENGLCLFENLNDHTTISDFRDYLVHFKYHAKLNRSILDMYGKVYDSFFSYNTKLKKSVSYILTNTLLSYFVNAKLSFSLCGTADYKPRNKENVKRKSACISIESAQTDYFTYKIRKIVKGKNGVEKIENDDSKCDEVMVEARDQIYIDEVVKLLEYKSDK